MNPETAEARDPLRLYDKMHLLSEILTETIRRSDLFTQINLRQFILILMDTTTDQAVIPEERIKEHFQTAENQDYSLTFEIADMDAAEKQKSPVSDGDSKT
jgi:GGDEF domain-containing protein